MKEVWQIIVEKEQQEQQQEREYEEKTQEHEQAVFRWKQLAKEANDVHDEAMKKTMDELNLAKEQILQHERKDKARRGSLYYQDKLVILKDVHQTEKETFETQLETQQKGFVNVNSQKEELEARLVAQKQVYEEVEALLATEKQLCATTAFERNKVEAQLATQYTVHQHEQEELQTQLEAEIQEYKKRTEQLEAKLVVQNNVYNNIYQNMVVKIFD